MRLLLLSINNTRCRLLVETAAGELQVLHHGPTSEISSATLQASLAPLAEAERVRLGVVLSSVVPAAEERARDFLARYPVTRVSADLKLNFSLADYPGRATLGGDRIADLAAAEHYPLPAIILDLGTAITVDVLDAERRYRGGMIAPGWRLFTEYLPNRTALLPAVELGASPPDGLGQDTRGAMAVGAHHGFRALVVGLLRAAESALGAQPAQSIIVTGGDAALFVEESPGLAVDPELAMRGLQILGRLNPPH